MSNFITSTLKPRCQSREMPRVLMRDPSDYTSIRRSKICINTIKPDESPTPIYFKQNKSLPIIKTAPQYKIIPNLFIMSEESKLKVKIEQEIAMKQTETLATYRTRLRGLFEIGNSISPKDNHTYKIYRNAELNVKTVDIKTSALPLNSKQPIPKKNCSNIKKNIMKVLKITNDPYYYPNILLNTKFTSFYSLLSIFSDNLMTFPYCARINKDNLRSEVYIPVSNTLLKPVKCTCDLEISLKEKLLQKFFLKVSEIKEKKPYLSRVYHKYHRVSCDNKVIIANYETISEPNSIDLRPNILKVLKNFSPHFHLILVTSKASDMIPCIISRLSEENVLISSIYIVQNLNQRYEKLLDYSQVFMDYQCDLPSRDCLVITHHNICDVEEVGLTETIGKKTGNKIKLNAERIPIASAEFQYMPVCVLLCNPCFPSDCKGLVRMSEDINSDLYNDYYSKLGFDFEFTIKFKGYNIIATDIPQRLLLEDASVDRIPAVDMNKNYCFLHNKPAKADKKILYFNMFFIYDAFIAIQYRIHNFITSINGF
jgi:hypothetical protein